MSMDENKQKLRRILEEFHSEGKLHLADEIVSPTYFVTAFLANLQARKASNKGRPGCTLAFPISGSPSKIRSPKGRRSLLGGHYAARIWASFWESRRQGNRRPGPGCRFGGLPRARRSRRG
jgi:hypothetical protein